MRLLQTGNRRRTTEATMANAVSSRSHAILQVFIEKRNKMPAIKDIIYGKLNLIDLAGSERGSVAGTKGKRLREGANINKSLLALGNCINALVDESLV